METKAYKAALTHFDAQTEQGGAFVVFDRKSKTRYATRRETAAVMVELQSLPDHSLWNLANALPGISDALPRPRLINAFLAYLHGFYQGYEDARQYFTDHLTKLRELIADEQAENAAFEGAARASAVGA
ncbi:hypothetical protein [Paraburkholderia sp. GAS32]|uniref:hypothetical protein n=1 Tax=Paraburkholderia sp. GAS32 TaxID=3035129 RepID=UPI003D1EAD6F